MKQLLPVIFSFSALLVTAQKLDSVQIATASSEESLDIRRRAFIPRLYWDYGKTALMWTEFESKTEIGLEFLFFERFQLLGELGQATLQPPDAFQNGEYRSDGQYYRIGVGFLTDIDQRNKIGIGLRYGVSSFDDQLSFSVKSPSGLNDTYSENIERTGLSASWYEYVLTSEKMVMLNKNNQESRLNRMVSVGLLFRYRVIIKYDNFQPIDVFSIPGFGRSLNRRFPAVNLFMKINLF